VILVEYSWFIQHPVNKEFIPYHVNFLPCSLCFLYLRSRYIAIANMTVTYCYRTVLLPYRTLTHSHSATSLYNLSQFKSISDYVTSCPPSNLRTGMVWPRVISDILAILDFKNNLKLNCCLIFSPFYNQHENLSSSGK
jgi:hypothetical protein